MGVLVKNASGPSGERVATMVEGVEVGVPVLPTADDCPCSLVWVDGGEENWMAGRASKVRRINVH